MLNDKLLYIPDYHLTKVKVTNRYKLQCSFHRPNNSMPNLLYAIGCSVEMKACISNHNYK